MSDKKHAPFGKMDYPDFLDKVVIAKDGKFIGKIWAYNEHQWPERPVIIGGCMAETFDSLLKFYQFEDGSPCGKRVSE